MDNGYKVLISGIPPTVHKDDFISMLLKYGDMVTMFISDRNSSDSMSSGYVVYKTKLECYRAISELNGQPPYYFTMQFGSTMINDGSNIAKRTEVSPVCCPPILHQKDKPNNNNSRRRVVNNEEINSYPLEVEYSRTRSYHCSMLRKDIKTMPNACNQQSVEVSRKYDGEDSIPGADTVMQKKNQAKWNEGRRRDGNSAQSQFQSVFCRENHDKIPGDVSVLARKDASVKVGSNILARPKTNQMSRGSCDIRSSVSSRRTGERKSFWNDLVTERKDEEINSFPYKNGVLKTNQVSKVHCDEILQGVSRSKEFGVKKHARGIDRGFRVYSEGVHSDPSSTIVAGKDNNAKSENHFPELVLEDSSNRGSDQCIEGQVSQELESAKTSNTLAMSKKIEKLISLLNCQKKEDEVDTGNLMEPSANSNKALYKSHTLPTVAEQLKPIENQETKSTILKWNMLSEDPETQIVDYDLCTQQKKLPSEVFSKVKICSLISSDEYWVQSMDKEEMDLIQHLIRNKKKTNETHFEPCLGEYCCVLLNDSWYRAKILSVHEMKIVAFLIDYGSIVCVQADLAEELPYAGKNVYAQAMHVKLDPRTPTEYFNCKEGEILTVKASGMIQKRMTKIQLKGVLYAQEVTIPKQLCVSSLSDEHVGDEIPCNTKGVQWPLSVLTLLNVGDEASCTVLNTLLSEDEDRDEVVLVIAFENIADDIESIARDLPDDCMEKPEDPEFNPSVGDLVASFSSKLNCWVRCIVLDVGEECWLVACFDFGFVEIIKEIREIPDDKKYKRVFALSSECCITKSLFQREDLFSEGRIEKDATLCATVLKKEDDCLECKLGSNTKETFCFVTLRAWSPKPDCSAYATSSEILPFPTLNLIKLTPGCPVKIVSYFVSLVIYVQPCETESKLLIEDLHKSITNFAVKNGPLKGDPIKGKKYICQYSGDMKYYRVIVKRIKNPTDIHVYYVDYGNVENVPKERLYELPTEFEKIPCCAVKIELKKRLNKTLNIDAQKYLSYLILENKELVLNYSDGNLKSAELLLHGNSLSDILERFVAQ